MSINKAIFSGNLTRDSELRYTAGGMAVLGFGVAVNDRRKNQQTGEWEEYPNFIDCTLFGARAESISRYLSKGTHVFVEGKLRWSQWERDGQKRSKIEIVVDEIDWNNPQQNAQQARYAPACAPQAGYPQQPPIQPQMAPQAASSAPAYYPQQQAAAYAPQAASACVPQANVQATRQASPQAAPQASAPMHTNAQAAAYVPASQPSLSNGEFSF